MKGTKPKVLMLAPAFAPFANPEAIVNSKLALALISHGWDVDIISLRIRGNATYEYISEWDDIWKPLQKNIIEIEYPTVSKLLKPFVWLDTLLKVGYPVSGARWINYATSQVIELNKTKKYDLLLSRFLPLQGHIAAMNIAKRTDIPWIANWNDPPLEWFPPPYSSNIPSFERIIKSFVYPGIGKNAEFHTFPSERLRKYILDRIKQIPSCKSLVIPHVMLNNYSPKRVKNSNIFVICHAGNLANERDPEYFFKAVGKLINQSNCRNKILIKIIGIESVNLMSKAKAHNVDSLVMFVGKKTYIETINEMVNCTIGLIVEASCSEGIFIPSKLTDYVQANLPVLAISPRDGTVADVLKEYGCGLSASCDSVDEIYVALKKMYSSWEAGSLENDFPVGKIKEHFSVDNVVSMYEEIWRSLSVANQVCAER